MLPFFEFQAVHISSRLALNAVPTEAVRIYPRGVPRGSFQQRIRAVDGASVGGKRLDCGGLIVEHFKHVEHADQFQGLDHEL